MSRQLTRLGRKFGRLTTLEWLPKIQSYRCMCECGTEKIVKNAYLGCGTNSCGCLRRDESLKRGGGPRRMRCNEIGRYYRRNAVVRSLLWSLSIEQLEQIITRPCTYCGEVGSLGFDFTGVDRTDNSKGYTSDNVVPCCKRCNQARNDMSVDEFLQWVEKVYSHLKGV